MARYELERERASLTPTAPTITTRTWHHRTNEHPGRPRPARQLPGRLHHADRRRLGVARPPSQPRRQPGRDQQPPPRLRRVGLDHPYQHPHLRRARRTSRPHHQLAVQLVEPGLRRDRTTRLRQLRRRRHHRRRHRLPMDLLPRQQPHRHPRRHRHRRSTTSVVRQHRPLRHRPPPPRDPHQRRSGAAHSRSSDPSTNTASVSIPPPCPRLDAASDGPTDQHQRRPRRRQRPHRRPPQPATLSDQQWDRAITALHIAREQHGGRIRHLIHVILDAGHHHTTGHLADALTELHCHLAVADDPPPAQPVPRRRRQRRTWPAHIQLELFNTDTPGDPRSAL